MPHKDPEKRRQYKKEWAASKPQSWHKANVEKRRLWSITHRDKDNLSAKKRRLSKRYGLTLEQREAMGDTCEICNRVFKPAVDHDHASNRVRGILCVKCNRGIGLFDDSPNRLRAAASYLERKSK